jgi:hypothetical protein
VGTGRNNATGAQKDKWLKSGIGKHVLEREAFGLSSEGLEFRDGTRYTEPEALLHSAVNEKISNQRFTDVLLLADSGAVLLKG